MSLSKKFGIPESLFEAAKKALDESNAYQQKVKAHMAKKGIKSLDDMSAEQKKKFFNELDAMHTAKNEEVESVDEASTHSGNKIEAKGVKGMKSTPWQKVFSSQKAFEQWLEKNSGDYEVHATREIPSAFGPSPADKLSIKSSTNEEVDFDDLDLEDVSIEDIENFMQTEEYDQLDELSKTTLGNYIKKRSNDVATQGAITRKHAMDSEAARKDQDYSQARKSNEKSDKAFAKGWKHRQNIGKAVDKLTKEEQEFIESLNAGTAKE